MKRGGPAAAVAVCPPLSVSRKSLCLQGFSAFFVSAAIPAAIAAIRRYFCASLCRPPCWPARCPERRKSQCFQSFPPFLTPRNVSNAPALNAPPEKRYNKKRRPRRTASPLLTCQKPCAPSFRLIPAVSLVIQGFPGLLSFLPYLTRTVFRYNTTGLVSIPLHKTLMRG